ncbi:uncharacterized protein [Apostichopus japonicus]|uniref:uncharacterized protein isoform X3 n=1 Tax=Stichopus japonicus TaxID=307972 RepID=UPI003AB8E16A
MNAELQFPSLSGGGPIKFAGTKTDRRTYGTDSEYGDNGAFPLLHDRNRLNTRTTRSDPSLKARRRRKVTEKTRHVNSAPTPVKEVRRPTNHDRISKKSKASHVSKSSHLPKLQTETHGVPTVKQVRTLPAESSKKWATSWAEIRATSLKRDDFNSPQSSSTSPSSCRTFSTKKTAKSEPWKVEARSKNELWQNKGSRESPFYAKSKPEIDSPKKRTKQYAKPETVKPKSLPPRLERTKSKIGFFNRDGAFVLDDEADPPAQLARSETVSVIRPRRAKSRTILTSQSAKTMKEIKKKPKLRRRAVVITKKTLSHEKSLKSVYGNRSFKLQRHVTFLKHITQAQKDRMEEENQMSEEKSRARIESLRRQRRELKEIRDRFDEEQVTRFRRQYVSWKSVEADRLNRNSEEYGLPDNIYDDRYDKTLKELSQKSTVNRKTRPFRQVATWMKNIKRFERLLNPQMSVNLENQLAKQNKALVEGIDIVELANGIPNDVTQSSTKQVKVDRVIGSARRILQSQEMDAISEVSSLEELQNEFRAINLDDRS